MHAVVITKPGGPEVLQWTEVPDIAAGPGEVLIDVAAAGVNRADLMQRQGFYDPPPGASPYPGLEVSGTMAIQLAKHFGATVAVTAGSKDKLQACRELGADIVINYREEDFVAALREATGGHGADVILDIMGAKYLSRNVDVLAEDGRLVIIGMQG